MSASRMVSEHENIDLCLQWVRCCAQKEFNSRLTYNVLSAVSEVNSPDGICPSRLR